jgi:hypothetical protein
VGRSSREQLDKGAEGGEAREGSMHGCEWPRVVCDEQGLSEFERDGL